MAQPITRILGLTLTHQDTKDAAPVVGVYTVVLDTATDLPLWATEEMGGVVVMIPLEVLREK